jgi:hypothetical protein
MIEFRRGFLAMAPGYVQDAFNLPVMLLHLERIPQQSAA